MSNSILEPVELRAKGFEALVKTLGWPNAVRFIQQFERSSFNYTVERDSILPEWDASEMLRQLKAAEKHTSTSP